MALERQKRLTARARKNFRTSREIVACCEICEKPFDGTKGIKVDHDHETGDARGLLCNSCNVGLGFFRDKPAMLQKAILYLSRDLKNPLKERPSYYIMRDLWERGRGKLAAPTHIWKLCREGRFPFPKGLLLYVEIWDREKVDAALAALPPLDGNNPNVDAVIVTRNRRGDDSLKVGRIYDAELRG